MDHSGMQMGGSPMQMDMSSMQGMAMDLNDYDWDAYLTNDRTLTDPDVIRVEKNGRVKLRVINGASATVFWIDTGALSARLVAVDGHAVESIEGTRFGIAMGQRLDLELDVSGEGAWPVLAFTLPAIAPQARTMRSSSERIRPWKRASSASRAPI